MIGKVSTLTLSLIVLTACSSGNGVDHIILGVPGLDEGIAAFEQATGVTPVRGGRHPGRGTENALASLGNGVYLELIAPQRDAPADEFTTYLRSLKQPTLAGWAVHVPDAKAAKAKIERQQFALSNLAPGSRITPDGKTLEWTTFGLTTQEIATAPFFIEWSKSTTHPSKTSPGGCAIDRFAIADPKGDELSRLLRAAGVHVPVTPADKPRMELALRCAGRTVSYSSE